METDFMKVSIMVNSDELQRTAIADLVVPDSDQRDPGRCKGCQDI